MIVALEGIDGVGKSLQTQLLQELWQDQNIRCVHFPQHHHDPFGKLISRFLAGDMGDKQQVDPYFTALLFACDQYALMQELRNEDPHQLLILDRYYYSNMAYQSAQIANLQEREDFRQWLEQVVGTFHLPPADLVFYLDIPEVLALKNMKERMSVAMVDHYEIDRSFQQKVKEEYQVLQQRYPQFIAISCASEDGTWRDPMLVHQEIVWYIREYMQRE
ncbi:dTMP kinase [Entomospira entomophila]|uniref:Thymidylate kinase n=1 Tax=Entomospira entomophila TaxID=2719988 RepID=A0A968KWG3_9SPIO|nr:dTMP kinase [Entomospira entomophilus]NIZ40785.1 dTMP kinase [Entomospira entomophilus]WDI34998.1 dTMP kinase [Entomospira entomophilus]